jgi:membrane protein DedA with SNARE-associated domain
LVEGPIIAVVAGFMIRFGYLDLTIAYLVMCAGDFLPDTLYYYIGKLGHSNKWIDRLGARFTSKSAFLFKNIKALERLWKLHGKKMMVLSKQAYGLSTPLLMSAGLVNMPYGRFIAYAFPVTLIQYAVFIAIGYWLGSSYELAAGYITYAGYIVAVMLIAIGVGYFFIQKYARKKVLALEESEDTI